MCHYNIKTLNAFAHFHSLRSLTVIAQDIKIIEGLEACIGLEELWICETMITSITGLQNMKSLRRLYLYSNKIQRLEGLGGLPLDTLSLADNEISILEGLDKLPALVSLNLANNFITCIHESLRKCQKLVTLNLAGNLLESLKEILRLTRLKSLKILSLNDPNYKANPVCSWSNYDTFIIHHLSRLDTFDTIELTDFGRDLIDATFAKKRM